MHIRSETPDDAVAISQLTTAAFAAAEHASGTEATIVERLRATGALTLSLVAQANDGEIVGHIAFSPVTIASDGGGAVTDWFGLGPVSVLPEHQGAGIGAALVREGLERLAATGAQGCVVLGDPDYYCRFGFIGDAGPRYPGPPAEYFQARGFRSHAIPQGVVRYHPAFGVE